VCFNLRKKAKFSEAKLKILIQSFYDNYQVVNIDDQTMILASDIRLSYNISFWDSLVISSALESKAQIIYTEDMQHNLIINDILQIINPF
jgi:predicted nucleic acid-binding protein